MGEEIRRFGAAAGGDSASDMSTELPTIAEFLSTKQSRQNSQ
jgi:hypothetical protein